MNALTLATRLALSVAQALRLRDRGHPTIIYIFSDSQKALSWLSSTRQTNLGILVENRLREIHRIVRQLEDEAISAVFGYVNTAENRADAGTRGLTKEQIINHNWWSGPQFLHTPVHRWTTRFFKITTSNEPTFEEVGNEEAANINTVSERSKATSDLLDWNRYSTFSPAEQITALALRFVKKLLRNKNEAFPVRIFEHIPELKEIP